VKLSKNMNYSTFADSDGLPEARQAVVPSGIPTSLVCSSVNRAKDNEQLVRLKGQAPHQIAFLDTSVAKWVSDAKRL
jgi:hypothetical protein